VQHNFVKLVENYTCSILTEKSPRQNVYHSIDHTKEVVNAVSEIRKGENISEDEFEIITISAWFHDLGYIERTKGHEEISAMFASNFLSENEYDSGKLEQVLGTILSTKVPQHPQNHLQQIICDADLHHVGKNTFETRNNLFRIESEFYAGKKLSDVQWLTQTIEFLTQHHFFTDYAIKYFSSVKEQNLLLMQLQLDSLQQ
jgi:uncharacterized protein